MTAGRRKTSCPHARKAKKRAVKEAKRALNPGVVAEKLEEAPDTEADAAAVSPERLSSM